MTTATLFDIAQSAADEQLAGEIGIAASVAECEMIADEISDGIKRSMPCDCRAAGVRGTRCGNCGQ